MSEFIDIPSVDLFQEQSLVELEPSVTDPLVGFGNEDEFYTYYRVDEKVFAEILPPIENETPNKDNVEKKNVIHEIELDNIISDPGNLVCPKENCNKSFPSRVHLKDHVRRVHNAKYNFECNFCDAVFPVAYRLKKHLSVHSSDKTQCPVCYKKLSVRTSMSHHMKLHDEQKYPCVQCGKVFAKKSILTSHLRFVHRTDKLLRCVKCQREFKKRLEYQNHLSEHMKERTLACEFCGHLFSTLAALGAHKAKKHER